MTNHLVTFLDCGDSIEVIACVRQKLRNVSCSDSSLGLSDSAVLLPPASGTAVCSSTSMQSTAAAVPMPRASSSATRKSMPACASSTAFHAAMNGVGVVSSVRAGASASLSDGGALNYTMTTNATCLRPVALSSNALRPMYAPAPPARPIAPPPVAVTRAQVHATPSHALERSSGVAPSAALLAADGALTIQLVANATSSGSSAREPSNSNSGSARSADGSAQASQEPHSSSSTESTQSSNLDAAKNSLDQSISRRYLQVNSAPNLFLPSGPHELLVHSNDSSDLHPTCTSAEPLTNEARRTLTSFASLNPATNAGNPFMSASFVYVPSASAQLPECLANSIQVNGSSVLSDPQPQRAYRSSLPTCVEPDVRVASPPLPRYPLRLSIDTVAPAGVSASELLAGDGGRAPNTFRRMLSDASPVEFHSAVDDPSVLDWSAGTAHPFAENSGGASAQAPACALENGSSLSRQVPNVQYEREFMSLPRNKQPQPPPPAPPLDRGPWSPMPGAIVTLYRCKLHQIFVT